MAEAETAVVYDARLGGYAVTVIGIESRPAAAPRHDAGRRAGAVVGGHAVPAVVEEGRPGHQRGERVPARRRAGQPVRLRRLAGVAAPPAARVRRRDRPGHRELRRADRAVRGVPLPRRRLRRVLGDAQRRHGGARRRGLVRLGHRWRARRGGRVHPRRRRAHTRRRAGAQAGGRGRRRRAAARSAHAWPSCRRCARPCARRSWARWPPSSTPSTASSGPRTSARCTASSPPASCAPELIAAVERGMGRCGLR